jgi:hypothetical protein
MNAKEVMNWDMAKKSGEQVVALEKQMGELGLLLL